ncbi:glycosyltransferase family 4 protein [Candidatus Fermentibacterales bacterium]|nr:glycosyltransferase family 4 protein [Candidatus Fermentibacterales bacterium]
MADPPEVLVSTAAGIRTPEQSLASLHEFPSGFRKVYLENLRLRRHVKLVEPDLVHLPAFAGAAVRAVPLLVTFHDVAFAARPEWFSPSRRIYYRLRFRRTAMRADHLIADSEFTAGELVSRMGVGASRITVVYLSAEAGEDVTPLMFRRKRGIEGDYALFVGTIEPRKNLGTLLDAWDTLTRDGIRVTLVVSGRMGWEKKEIRDRLRRARDVVWTGELSEEELASAYSGAKLLVYPSLYEGFGLPPLEAACYGVPSVIGPAAALREVYGSVAAGIAGADAGSLAMEIARGLETHHSRRAIRDFARSFTHERMASGVAGVYRRLSRR